MAMAFMAVVPWGCWGNRAGVRVIPGDGGFSPPPGGPLEAAEAFDHMAAHGEEAQGEEGEHRFHTPLRCTGRAKGITPVSFPEPRSPFTEHHCSV